MKRLLVALVAAVLAFVVLTVWALEASGVAVVVTTTPAGEERRTHVWFVEADGTLWLEAGAPENPWFLDAQHSGTLHLERDDAPTADYDIRVEPERFSELRRMLRSKYGWRDRWVGMFVDASRSTAVRLLPSGTAQP